MAFEPVRVGCIGMGWWSDVLADAIKRSGKLSIVACYSRSEQKRKAFAAKYGCRAATSYEEILADSDIDAIVNTTPNNVHLETTRAAAQAGKHVFSRQADRELGCGWAEDCCRVPCCRGRACTRIPAAPGESLSLDSQADRGGNVRQARECRGRK